LFCVLSTAAGFLHLGTWTIRQSITRLGSPPSPSTSLPVVPFQYLTTFVSECDGRVSIGPSSKTERIPVGLVTLGLTDTGYSVNIRRNWNQEPTSSHLCDPRPATPLTYPLATMRVSSAYRPTWQGVSLTGLGTSIPGSTSRDSIRRSTSFHGRMHEWKSSRRMIAHSEELTSAQLPLVRQGRAQLQSRRSRLGCMCLEVFSPRFRSRAQIAFAS
jgi:hypothetical protein